MKKTMSALLALLLLALTALPAAAEDTDYNKVMYSIEDGYMISYILDDSSGTTTFSYLFYYPLNAKESYIPRSYLGVEITPEILCGTRISFRCAPFRVDADNPYFSVRDGALYTKDGETLISVPHRLIYGNHSEDDWEEYWRSGMYAVPDNTRRLGRYSVDAEEGACIILPDSVTQIDPDCGIYGAIAAAPGGAAEAYAREHGNEFIALGETHKHTYFRISNDANCTQGGNVRVQCPCGKVVYTETTDPIPDAHWFELCTEPGTNTVTRRCAVCDTKKPDTATHFGTDCKCACHTIDRFILPGIRRDFRTTLKNCIYRVRLFFWRMTGKHQYCTCGARHY